MAKSPRAEPDQIGEESGAAGEFDRSGGVRSLARGLRILSCFDSENPAWSLSDLSRHLKIHRATVHRFLKTLEADGFLVLDPANGQYYLGAGAFRLGQAASLNSELIRIARPYMERLAVLSGESVGLAAWIPEGALFLDMAFAPHQSFRPRTQVGRVFRDIRSAHYRVFLAFMDSERRARAFARAREMLEPGLAIDFDRLSIELDGAALEGFAFDLEGSDRGVGAVAAPVFGAAGLIRASLSVVAPIERFGPVEQEANALRVKETAAELSHNLGY